jgi:hypothetical protein
MPLSWAIPAGMSILGGLMGSEEKTVGKTNPTSQTTNSSHGSSTQHKLDPRMEQAIYGAGGIMPNAAAWYAQNQSGLNQNMVTGMNNQWNQLGASTQGFNQMQNLGMGLMGGGAAGNPFTGGGGIAPQKMSYTPANFSAGGENPFTMPAAQVPAPSMYGGGGGGGGGGGYGGGYEPVGNSMNEGNSAVNAGGGEPMYDVEGMLINGNGGRHAGYSGYRADNTPYQSIVPTTSTAGYGGYGGYSTLPAYSYPSGGGNGGV